MRCDWVERVHVVGKSSRRRTDLGVLTSPPARVSTSRVVEAGPWRYPSPDTPRRWPRSNGSTICTAFGFTRSKRAQRVLFGQFRCAPRGSNGSRSTSSLPGAGLRIHWPLAGRASRAIRSGQAITQLVRAIKRAARICADAGCTCRSRSSRLCVQHARTPSRILARSMTRVPDQLRSEHFDLMSAAKANPRRCSNNSAFKHIGHVHLTTRTARCSRTSKHLPCGEGHCDIRPRSDFVRGRL